MKRRRFLWSLAAGSIVCASGNSLAFPPPKSIRGRTALTARANAKPTERFPYPIVRAPGSEALQVWRRLRAKGGTPVILGGEPDFERVAGFREIQAEDDLTPQRILAKAATYNFPEDLRARVARERGAFQEPPISGAETHSRAEVEAAPDAWPDRAPADPGLTVNAEFVTAESGYSVRPYDEVVIAHLPTDDWTEAFAYLAFGGWNACPMPHEHVAAFRYWTARYDLALVGMSGDVLNLRAGRAPQTRAKALSLAREQYDFCADIVDQGIGLQALAAGLMAGNWWYFWWD